MHIIPEALRAERKLMGLTQAEFAAKLGVAVRTLQQWESGDRNPEGKNLQSIVSVTGKPSEHFLSGKPDMNRPGVLEYAENRPRYLDNVRRFRIGRGISAEDFRERTGLSKEQIADIIQGRTLPDRDLLSTIAKALGVKVEDLTGNDPFYWLPRGVEGPDMPGFSSSHPEESSSAILYRSAPIAPSHAKAVRAARERQRKAMDMLAQIQADLAGGGDIMPAMAKIAQAQRELVAAQTELERIQ